MSSWAEKMLNVNGYVTADINMKIHCTCVTAMAVILTTVTTSLFAYIAGVSVTLQVYQSPCRCISHLAGVLLFHLTILW